MRHHGCIVSVMAEILNQAGKMSAHVSIIDARSMRFSSDSCAKGRKGPDARRWYNRKGSKHAESDRIAIAILILFARLKSLR